MRPPRTINLSTREHAIAMILTAAAVDALWALSDAGSDQAPGLVSRADHLAFMVEFAASDCQCEFGPGSQPGLVEFARQVTEALPVDCRKHIDSVITYLE